MCGCVIVIPVTLVEPFEISSSSLFVPIKIHDANKEQIIKPEQDSKVEKTTLTAALE